MNVIDLFSGCGGLTEGFLRPEFDILAHVEWEKKPASVLRRRLKQVSKDHDAQSVITFDIQRSNDLIHGYKRDKKYGTHAGLDSLVQDKTVDLVIGGPPCQAYSMAGRIRDENGMKDDYRNYLFESFMKIVRHYSPKFFVFENVKGMLSSMPDGTPIVDLIRKEFDDAGYSTIDDYSDAVFDMSKYGVPQQRERVIILGVRTDAYKDASKILTDFYSTDPKTWLIPKQNPITAKDAIGDLPSFEPLKRPRKSRSHHPKKSKISGHFPRYHNKRDVGTFRMLTEDLRDKTGLYKTTEDIKELYTKRTGKTSSVHKYSVIHPDEPSNTIVAHMKKDGLRHIHWDPEQARTITVREAADLQGFPRDFEFPVNMGAAYEMIGNAVPPPFAHLLADAILRIVEIHKSVEIQQV